MRTDLRFCRRRDSTGRSGAAGWEWCVGQWEMGYRDDVAAVLALEAGRPAEALRLMGDSADTGADDLREAAKRALSATAR